MKQLQFQFHNPKFKEGDVIRASAVHRNWRVEKIDYKYKCYLVYSEEFDSGCISFDSEDRYEKMNND